MTTLEEQIPGGMTTASTTNYLVFEAPCCSSIRECNVKAHYVISVLNAKILRVIRAVRCYRGYTVKYKFYPSDDVILVHHYVSNLLVLLIFNIALIFSITSGFLVLLS